MKEVEVVAAIKAGMGYTGTTRRELADKIGMAYDTLCRKIRQEQHFDLSELEKADKAIGWSHHLRRQT